MPKERIELLDRSWSEAAELYLQELAPRFDPWFQLAVNELKAHDLPPGPILVPCCGPGQELLPLHALYGGQRRVVGLDLSHGMIDLARAAIAAADTAATDAASAPSSAAPTSTAAGQPQGLTALGQGHAASGGVPQQQQEAVEAVVADATALDAFGPAAAVVSVFGLQQMGPLAPAALANWGKSLAPGGVAVVVLWPSRVEDMGPWCAYDQVVLEKAAADKGQPPPPPDAAARAQLHEWEQRLTDQLRAEAQAEAEAEGGGDSTVEVLADRLQEYEMSWPSPEYFWRVMTEGGPWRARRLAQGDAAMRDLGNRFADKYGGMGSHRYTSETLSHTPAARLVVLRRRRTPGGGGGAGGGGGGGQGGQGGQGGGAGEPRMAK